MQSLPNTKIGLTIDIDNANETLLAQAINNGGTFLRMRVFSQDIEKLEFAITIARKVSPYLPIIVEPQGKFLRINNLEKDLILKRYDKLAIIPKGWADQNEKKVEIDYPDLAKEVVVGTKIFMNNHQIPLQVTQIYGKTVICKVLANGILVKGDPIDIEIENLDPNRLTKDDSDILAKAIKFGADYLVIPGVDNVSQLRQIKKGVSSRQIKYLVKIKGSKGIKNFDEIIQEADGIFIDPEEVASDISLYEAIVAIKQMIQKVRRLGKNSIIEVKASKLISLNSEEISSIINLVQDRVDCLNITLKAREANPETVSGIVNTVAHTVINTEKFLTANPVTGDTLASDTTDTLCRYVSNVVDELDLKGALILTRTGKTAYSLARHRLKTPIWSVTMNLWLGRQISLLHAIRSFIVDTLPDDRDELVSKAVKLIFEHGEVDAEDKIALVMGSTVEESGLNSIVEVIAVKDVLA
ncbi:hypothetical protein GF357_00710 [Candidatus Dojkabacteria bacterium]|nr:hypothetical protein [Candidatus Dojkabacteria bacterium]